VNARVNAKQVSTTPIHMLLHTVETSLDYIDRQREMQGKARNYRLVRDAKKIQHNELGFRAFDKRLWRVVRSLRRYISPELHLLDLTNRVDHSVGRRQKKARRW
jgi:hypothetical protein